MKNRKAYAIICWIVAAMAFLAALLISEGKIENVTKQAVLLLVMGAGLANFRNRTLGQKPQKVNTALWRSPVYPTYKMPLRMA